ncbi:MAG: 4Fe-4S binding protein [Methanobacteriota archaeon]|nr:MAG: 4Fe-4S binding protein [Euryarchaeota archaeon]
MKRPIRNRVQIAIIIFLLYIGWRFYLFVTYFQRGMGLSPPPRPASVEAFLPISALIAFRAWISTGVFDRIHPAGLAIFLAIIITSLLLKRGFCSWLCPIGAASEGLWKTGKRVFGQNFLLPRPVDLLLMLPKYLILAFFLKVALIDMTGPAALGFLNGPYNKIVDARMLVFWIKPGVLTIEVTLLLIAASIFVQNFWCRYLCPYGALLGLLSHISPLKVSRDPDVCINCGACTRACPNRIDVDRTTRVSALECTSCLMCIDACPVDALSLRSNPGNRVLETRLYPAALLGLFFLIIIVAKATGHWHTSITTEEYARLIPIMHMFSH